MDRKSPVLLQIPSNAEGWLQSNFRKISDELNSGVSLNNQVNSPTSGLGATTGTIKISSHDNVPDFVEIKLLAGTGITFTKQHPNFNETLLISAHVAVTLATNHGLGLSGQVLNMGTPSTCTNVTTNAVTTTTHTHAITGFLTAVTAHNVLSTTHGDSTVSVPNDQDVLTWDTASSKWIAKAGGGGGGPHVLLSLTHTDTLADTVIAGDVLIGNATPKWARLAKSTDGKVLTLTSGLPSWETPSGGTHELLSATHTDTTASTVVRGDIIIGSGATPKWDNLAIGASTTYLKGGTEPSWATLNQAAVDDLMTTDSPVFVTVKLSDLTDDYIPYHVNDATGLANGPTKTNVDSAVSLKHAAVTLAANHGLSLSTQEMAMGTPSTCTAATTNAVTTTTHTHAITGFLTAVTVHDVLSTTHGDSTADSVARGDLITGQGATPKWVRLIKGTNGYFLKSDGTDTIWAAHGLTYSDVGASPLAGSSSLITVGSITTGEWHGTAVAADHGGTGQIVYAVGDILYASTTTALSKLADVAVLSYLASGGVGAAPSWLPTNTAPVVEIATAEPAGRDNGHLWYDSDGVINTLDILMIEMFSGG